MAKATADDLGELSGVVAKGLTEVLKEGCVVGLDTEGQPIKAPASAAFFMAAITLLKNNNITADPAKNAELAGLAETLAAKRSRSKAGMQNMADTLRDAGHALERELGGPLQ
jgi:hypothetical protein